MCIFTCSNLCPFYLRNRPIKEEFKEIKLFKEELFELKIKLASCNKLLPWTMEDLERVLKSLKNGKARDPNRWTNELFSKMKLFNKIKI